MSTTERLYFLDNLRTFLIFLVVVVHAGIVYESSGTTAAWWIVDDAAVSDVPGLVNLMLDILIMPTIFFISGFFTPLSLEKKGGARFLATRARRLLVPWILALLVLMPLYKIIFLYSRGLPQQDWTSYFHFSNGILGMSWLWFLPVLFVFDCLHVMWSKLSPPTAKLSLGGTVTLVLVLGFVCTYGIGALGLSGWTKTPIIDFQNEKVLVYLLVFLLGSHCQKLGVFRSNKRQMGRYIAVVATVWLPLNVYVFVLLNFIFNPDEYFFSGWIDGALLWLGYHLSVLGMLYCLLATFHYFFNRQSRLGAILATLSFDVYIIHVIVLGFLALGLLAIDLPGSIKYPLLAVSTWVLSNLIAYGYQRLRHKHQGHST